MKKIKSYTLIEVVIASFIFMVVSVMATVSFGMIRSANEKAATLKNAGECREILQNYLKSEVKSSNDGERIMGIKADYTLVDVPTKNDLVVTDTDKYVGVALFQSEGKYKIIYKNGDGHYFFSEITGLAGTAPVISFPNQDELLKNGDISCVASDTTPTPFTIISVKQNGSDTAHTFKISLSDKIFTQYGTAIPNFGSDKNFAVTQAEVINSDSGI